ncbi:MAG TPA: hypothetical protein VF112_08710 [Candidatus Dormibacteraeota bacterium]
MTLHGDWDLDVAGRRAGRGAVDENCEEQRDGDDERPEHGVLRSWSTATPHPRQPAGSGEVTPPGWRRSTRVGPMLHPAG